MNPCGGPYTIPNRDPNMAFLHSRLTTNKVVSPYIMMDAKISASKRTCLRWTAHPVIVIYQEHERAKMITCIPLSHDYWMGGPPNTSLTRQDLKRVFPLPEIFLRLRLVHGINVRKVGHPESFWALHQKDPSFAWDSMSVQGREPTTCQIFCCQERLWLFEMKQQVIQIFATIRRVVYGKNRRLNTKYRSLLESQLF